MTAIADGLVAINLMPCGFKGAIKESAKLTVEPHSSATGTCDMLNLPENTRNHYSDEAIDCPFSVCGTGVPLILIHGIGASRQIWKFVLPELSRHFRVLTYDLRGHGASVVVSSDFCLDHLVNDLERVRSLAGFEQAHFAGHSLGGMIAPAYAKKHPGRVLSLGLLSTAAGRTEEDSANVLRVVDEMTRLGVSKVLPQLTDRWFTDHFLHHFPDIVEGRLKQVIDTPEDIFLNVFRIYATTEMLPWLHEIKAPSLVLTGENDGGCNPRLNRLIADRLSNSRLVVLPHLKHAILLEAGRDVACHLRDFIQSLPVGESPYHEEL